MAPVATTEQDRSGTDGVAGLGGRAFGGYPPMALAAAFAACRMRPPSMRIPLQRLWFALLLGPWAGLQAQTHFPAPPAPSANPSTPAKELLGMALFWEEQLSHSDAVSCGTCHRFRSGGADPRVATHPGLDGVYGTADDIRGSAGALPRNGSSMFAAVAGTGTAVQVTTRKAPSVINAGYSTLLFYDGRASSIEDLALQPVLSHIEMGYPGRTESSVIAKLQRVQPMALASNLPQRLAAFVGNQSYPNLFAQAFGSSQITGVRIAQAIASYVRTLVSDESKFDHYLAGSAQLTAQEALGLHLFTRTRPNGTTAGSCVQCHGDISPGSHVSGPVFEGNTPYGTPQQHDNFHNTGIRPASEDTGRGHGTFKVPMLRNVALRAPYFHTGGMADLGAVIDFYGRGGDFHDNQAPEIQPIQFSPTERSALIAFLNTLTDPRVQLEQAPFDRPTLYSERNPGPSVFGSSMTSATHRPVQILADSPAFPGKSDLLLGAQGVEPFQWSFLLLDLASTPLGQNLGGGTFFLGLSPALTAVSAGVGFGSANLMLSIPNLPQLAGTTVYAQWAATDSSNPAGFVTSDALALPIAR